MRITTMIFAALALAVAAPAVSHAQARDSRPAVGQHVRGIRHERAPRGRHLRKRARMHRRHVIRRRFGRRRR